MDGNLGGGVGMFTSWGERIIISLIITGLYIVMVMPLLFYPYWPLSSVWDILSFAVKQVGVARGATFPVFLIWYLMSLSAFGTLGVLQLFNRNVPFRRRLLTFTVLFIGSVPLGFVRGEQSGLLLIEFALQQDSAGKWFWLVLSGVVLLAKLTVFFWCLLFLYVVLRNTSLGLRFLQIVLPASGFKQHADDA